MVDSLDILLKLLIVLHSHFQIVLGDPTLLLKIDDLSIFAIDDLIQSINFPNLASIVKYIVIMMYDLFCIILFAGSLFVEALYF